MSYPEEMVRPMREELSRIGVRELKTPEEVDALLARQVRQVGGEVRIVGAEPVILAQVLAVERDRPG